MATLYAGHKLNKSRRTSRHVRSGWSANCVPVPFNNIADDLSINVRFVIEKWTVIKMFDRRLWYVTGM